jgi:peptidoglycan/LPS O-acetylase OafA/YrhL
VDLFFVLSGFLVSGLLFREHEKFGKISGLSFLIRRGFKIYPPFWLLILVTVAVWFARDHVIHPRSIASELFFFQNYFSAPYCKHTWSLAVEEHFYLFLLAMSLVFAARRSPPTAFTWVPVTFGILAVVCLVLRIRIGLLEPFYFKTHIFPTHLRMDSLFAGVLLSYLHHFHPAAFLDFVRRHRWGLLLCTICFWGPAFIYPLNTTPWMASWGLTAIYLGSASLLSVAITLPLPENAWVRVLSGLGSHSYSIYLWHIPIVDWVAPALSQKMGASHVWYYYSSIYLLGSLGIGVVLSDLLETPALRMRDRWFPSRARPLSLVVPQR